MRKVLLLVFSVVVIVILINSLQAKINAKAVKIELNQENPFSNLPATSFALEYVSSFLLGGLKPLAINYLWLEYERLDKDFQYYETLVILKAISKLQPHYEKVWSYLSQTLVYNLSQNGDVLTERLDWLVKGLNFLEEGIRRNPNSLYLRFLLAFSFYQRFFLEPQIVYEYEKLSKESPFYKSLQLFLDLSSREEKKYGSRISFGHIGFIYAASLSYALELIRNGKYDEVPSYLAIAKDNARKAYEYMKNIKIYPGAITFWLEHIQTIEYIENNIISLEKKYREAKNPRDKEEYLNQLISEYKNMYNKFSKTIPDDLIFHTVKLFTDKFNMVTKDIGSSTMDEIRSRISKISEEVKSFVSEDNITFTVWQSVFKWFNETQGCVELEVKARASNVKSIYLQAKQCYMDLEEKHSRFSFLISGERMKEIEPFTLKQD